MALAGGPGARATKKQIGAGSSARPGHDVTNSSQLRCLVSSFQIRRDGAGEGIHNGGRAATGGTWFRVAWRCSPSGGRLPAAPGVSTSPARAGRLQLGHAAHGCKPYWPRPGRQQAPADQAFVDGHPDGPDWLLAPGRGQAPEHVQPTVLAPPATIKARACGRATGAGWRVTERPVAQTPAAAAGRGRAIGLRAIAPGRSTGWLRRKALPWRPNWRPRPRARNATT